MIQLLIIQFNMPTWARMLCLVLAVLAFAAIPTLFIWAAWRRRQAKFKDIETKGLFDNGTIRQVCHNGDIYPDNDHYLLKPKPGYRPQPPAPNTDYQQQLQDARRNLITSLKLCQTKVELLRKAHHNLIDNSPLYQELADYHAPEYGNLSILYQDLETYIIGLTQYHHLDTQQPASTGIQPGGEHLQHKIDLRKTTSGTLYPDTQTTLDKYIDEHKPFGDPIDDKRQPFTNC